MEYTVEAKVTMKVESEKGLLLEAEDKALFFLDQLIGDGSYDSDTVPGVEVDSFDVALVSWP